MNPAFYSNVEELLSKFDADVGRLVAAGPSMMIYRVPEGYLYFYDLEQGAEAFERKRKRLPHANEGGIEDAVSSGMDASDYEAIGFILTKIRPLDG